MFTTSQKNTILLKLAEKLEQRSGEIIEANGRDREAYPDRNASMKDRLTTDERKIASMAESLRQVAALPDPEGKVLYAFTREDGLRIENRTVPFGTILIIYESRPDVTIEAAATAFKAGNRILLKGGKEARHTNLQLAALWREALVEEHIDENYITYLDLSHDETQRLIRENSRHIDLIIPRGGEGLIRFVRENTSIPLLISGRGNNFLFADRDCDWRMVIDIVLNGKSRVSVCNALDKVLIDEQLPDISAKLATLMDALTEKGIHVTGDAAVHRLYPAITQETDAGVLSQEFLSPRLYIATASDTQDAIETINRYSGGHSAAIVTNRGEQADAFMQQVDCAAVYQNASTRFTDGGQFGVGAEIAISTQKLHFRGPLGAQELVTNKWFVYGNGHTRI